MKTEKKIIKSFRLGPEAVKLIAHAAKASGLSEGDVVENCVVEQIENVVEAAEKERRIEASALRSRLRKRDRKPREITRSTEKSVAPVEVLTKRR